MGAREPVPNSRARNGNCFMPRTILVVDDDDLVRGMLRSLLEMHGYTTLVAKRGSEGLALAAENNIDAALVDLDMPEMTGVEFCQRLRTQNEATDRSVPMWIMTGLMRPGIAKKAEAAGALLVLRKPLKITETCAQFEQEFEARAQAESAQK